jgi:hypothetical protein
MYSKRILREETQNLYVDKVFDIIKGGLNAHPSYRVRFGFGDFDRRVDRNQGINVILGKGRKLGSDIEEYFVKNYGMSIEESQLIYEKIRHYLKKEYFVNTTAWSLYIDWLSYQETPYYFEGVDTSGNEIKLNLKKIGDFIKFMGIVTGVDSDAHSDERLDFLPMLDMEDYKYIQSDIFEYISGEKKTEDFYESVPKSIVLKETFMVNEYDQGGYYEDRVWDDILDKKVYENIFKYFDKLGGGDKIFLALRDLDLGDDDFSNNEIESNLIYKYLTEHVGRPPQYVQLIFTPDDIKDFFYDGENGIREMVNNLLSDSWEYDYNHECMDFDDSLFDMLDKENITIMKEQYNNEVDLNRDEVDFKTYVEEGELGDDIGCAAGDAQMSADIDSLHNDFLKGILNFCSNFNGKLNYAVDKDGNKGHTRVVVADFEIGDLISSPMGKEAIYSLLEDGYPDFKDFFVYIIERESENLEDGLHEQDNYFLPKELITINEDKHFRYGGAGDIDRDYFNEIISDKLNWY